VLSAALLSAAFWFTLISTLSGYYYWLWLTAKEEMEKLISLAIMLSIVAMVILVGSAVLSSDAMRSPLSQVLACVLLYAALRQVFRSFPCRGKALEGPHYHRGIAFYVCRGRRASHTYNAWFYRGKVVVSEALLEILDEEELHAVLRHELGHAKRKGLAFLNRLLASLWIFVVASILAISVSLPFFSNVAALDWLLVYGVLYFVVAAISAPLIVISWINEHEVDAEASKYADPSRISTALVKMSLAETLSRIRGGMLEAKLDPGLRDLKVSIAARKPPFHRVAYEVFKAVIYSAPRDVAKFLKNPLYMTHPPMWIRAWYVMKRAGIYQWNGLSSKAK